MSTTKAAQPVRGSRKHLWICPPPPALCFLCEEGLVTPSLSQGSSRAAVVGSAPAVL